VRWVLLLPILYAAAVLQTAAGDLLRIGAVEPNLLALTAIVWLIVVPGPRMFLVAGAIGLLEDLLTTGPVGLGMGCFLMVGYALGRLQTQIRVDHLAIQIAAVLVGASLIAVAQAVGFWLSSETPAVLAVLLVRALGVGAYTAGMSIPVLMVLGWLRETRKKADAFSHAS